jgi:hypothetical protein
MAMHRSDQWISYSLFSRDPSRMPVSTCGYRCTISGYGQAAQAAGCPLTVTPFNGEHNAGIQVLKTSNYLDD